MWEHLWEQNKDFQLQNTHVSGATTPYTVGHGLSKSTLFIVWKSTSGNWVVYHASTGNQVELVSILPLYSSSEGYLNNTSSSTVITMATLKFTGDMMIYSWHDVPGLPEIWIVSFYRWK